MSTLPNVSPAGHTEALAVAVKPQPVSPAVPGHVCQSPGGLRERQDWSGRFPAQHKGLSDIVQVQPENNHHHRDFNLSEQPSSLRYLLDEFEPGGEVHPDVCFAHLFPHDGGVHRSEGPPVNDSRLFEPLV